LGNDAANNLSGLAGADTLNGGRGNDALSGGAGGDSYVFARGDGQDVVTDMDATGGATDTVQWLSGVAIDQLWFRHVGNNLEASIIGTSDKVTIQNWYLGTQYQVEQFKTADGKTLLDSKVQGLVAAMGQFVPPALGQTTLPESYQASLQAIVVSSWGG
jgi:Ca2+-binding RTX toxin-like protein